MFEKPKVVKKLRFIFDLLPTDVGGWIAADRGKRSFATEDLAEHLVRFYPEHGRGA